MKYIGDFQLDNRGIEAIEQESYENDLIQDDALHFVTRLKKIRNRGARRNMIIAFKKRHPKVNVKELIRSYTPELKHLEDAQNLEDADIIENGLDKKINPRIKKLVLRYNKAKNPKVKMLIYKALKRRLPNKDIDAIIRANSFENYFKKGKLKKFGKKFLKISTAIGTGGASLLADKKARQKAGGLAKKGIKVAKKVAKSVGKLVGAMTVFAPLLPFRPLMIKQIKAKGVPVSKGIGMGDLTKLFHKTVVLKKGAKNKYEHLEDPDVVYMLENNSFETLEATEQHIVGDVVKLVGDVFGFLKNITGKKNKTKAEAVLAADVEAVTAGLQAKADNENAVPGPEIVNTKTDGKILGMPKTVAFGIGIAIVGLIVFLIIRRK